MALGAEVIAAMHDGDLRGKVGQKQRFLDRGVAAADHHDFLAAIEKSVAGRAGGDAETLEFSSDGVPSQLAIGRPLDCDSATSISPKPFILATGAQARWLGTPSKKNSRVSASPPARPATDFSIAARKSWWSAAATPRSRKRCSDQLCLSSHRRASPRSLPRRAHPAGAPVQEPKIKVGVGLCIDEICGTENPGKVTHVRLKNVKTARGPNCRRTASSSRSDTRPQPS